MLLRLPRERRERVKNAALPTARWLLQPGSRASVRGSALGPSRVRYWRCRTLGYGLRRRSSTSGFGFIPNSAAVEPPVPTASALVREVRKEVVAFQGLKPSGLGGRSGHFQPGTFLAGWELVRLCGLCDLCVKCPVPFYTLSPRPRVPVSSVPRPLTSALIVPAQAPVPEESRPRP